MNNRLSSKKVCILIDSLGGGGAERSAGLLSKALSQINFHVTTIIFIDKIDFPFQGNLINLGNEFSNGFFQKIKKYRKFHFYIKKEEFDFILDFRMKNFPIRELLLNNFVFNKSKIVNMVRSSHLDYYFPKPKKLSKLLYGNYFGINAVSSEMAGKIEEDFRFKNVFSISNPIDFKEVETFSQSERLHQKEFILAVGRMDDDVKQFDKLINLYSKLKLKDELDLIIIGDGKNSKSLKLLAEQHQLQEEVYIFPFQKNLFPYYTQARFFVLCSKFEGFPRVILESLACGTPVVAFNCETGPSELIKTGTNGILVENQNFAALGEAMTKMQNDISFYNICKANAAESVKQYDLPQIGAQWRSYLEKDEK